MKINTVLIPDRPLRKLEDNLLDFNRVNSMLQIPSVASDFVTSICGKFIGSGVYRSVFEYNLDSRFVVKIEPRNTNCNIVEHMIWDEVRGLCNDMEWIKNWFAPVEWISQNGCILLMRKTTQVSNKERPEKVPKFFCDVHLNNFGWIGKNYVCHDYGQFYNMIEYKKGFKKIKW